MKIDDINKKLSLLIRIGLKLILITAIVYVIILTLLN